MIKTSIEKLSKEIGYDIGMSDNEVQCNLLNGLFESLSNSMDESHLQTQICYIVDGLSDKSINIIKEVNEFIKLKHKK